MWVIRTASPEDAVPLSELAERTFRETFAHQNAPEDMDLHCARAYGPAIQAAEIADRGKVTLLAEDQGSLIGYAQLHDGPSPPCVQGAPALEIHRIYVDARLHGTGVAQALMDAAVEQAMMRAAATVWLGVWERNPRAIAFYRRMGFTEVGEHTFLLGNDVQRDLVMAVPVASYIRRSVPR